MMCGLGYHLIILPGAVVRLQQNIKTFLLMRYFQGEERLKQESKRPALQGPRDMLKTQQELQTDILRKWKQDPGSQSYEMSALDCLGLNEDKAIKKARRKIKNKVRFLKCILLNPFEAGMWDFTVPINNSASKEPPYYCAKS